MKLSLKAGLLHLEKRLHAQPAFQKLLLPLKNCLHLVILAHGYVVCICGTNSLSIKRHSLFQLYPLMFGQTRQMVTAAQFTGIHMSYIGLPYTIFALPRPLSLTIPPLQPVHKKTRFRITTKAYFATSSTFCPFNIRSAHLRHQFVQTSLPKLHHTMLLSVLYHVSILIYIFCFNVYYFQYSFLKVNIWLYRAFYHRSVFIFQL